MSLGNVLLTPYAPLTGFKNVSLGNVLRAAFVFGSAERIPFLSAGDQTLYRTTIAESFDLQVGLYYYHSYYHYY